jgi:hypothetical protein
LRENERSSARVHCPVLATKNTHKIWIVIANAGVSYVKICVKNVKKRYNIGLELFEFIFWLKPQVFPQVSLK